MYNRDSSLASTMNSELCRCSSRVTLLLHYIVSYPGDPWTFVDFACGDSRSKAAQEVCARAAAGNEQAYTGQTHTSRRSPIQTVRRIRECTRYNIYRILEDIRAPIRSAHDEKSIDGSTRVCQSLHIPISSVSPTLRTTPMCSVETSAAYPTYPRDLSISFDHIQRSVSFIRPFYSSKLNVTLPLVSVYK